MCILLNEINGDLEKVNKMVIHWKVSFIADSSERVKEVGFTQKTNNKVILCSLSIATVCHIRRSKNVMALLKVLN